MTAEQMLITLCREELCGNAPTEIAVDALPALQKLAKQQDVSHIVAAALQRRSVPDRLAAQLRKEQQLAMYRYERMQHEYERICTVLGDEKIPYLPLKGAVVRDYYPQRWMRTSCDIDILVHEEDLDRAVAALTERLGYQSRNKQYHDVWLFSENGVHLELHFSIRENDARLDPLLSRVWEYAVSEDGVAFCLQPDFFVFHTVAHMCYHFMGGGCGVRAVMDLWVLRHCMGYDRDAVAALCAACGIDTFFDAAEQLAEAWFSGAKASPLTEDMGAFILKAGPYGDLEARAAVKRREGGMRYLWRRVFPTRDSMTLLYPVLKRHPALLLPCYVRRWCGVLNGEKRRRMQRELQAHVAAGSRSAEVASLFDRLKL